MSAAVPHRVPALPAIALAVVAMVVLTGVLSPLALALLHRAGAAGAGLEAVTLRTLELTGIALTVVLLSRLGGNGRRAWGVPPLAGLVPRVAAGVALGVATLAPVCVVLFVLGVRVVRVDVDPDAAWWLEMAARAALPAAAVAVLEELWFRGGLFTLLERCGGPRTALWAGAAIYAAAHFLKAPDEAALRGAGVADAFAVLGHAAAAVLRPGNVDSFVALLLAGLALGLVRLRQGHVALAIGIHAGWVLTIKVFKKFTFLPHRPPYRGLVGSYDEVIGWLAVLTLGLLLLALWWRLEPRREAP